MNCIRIRFLLSVLGSFFLIHAIGIDKRSRYDGSRVKVNSSSPVCKKVLKNGLTVLVRPMKTTQDVSVQLWYNVGSKDEKAGQKGIAHLIEHMIFKGTQKMSEPDINMISQKLSAKCNAMTSSDFTTYFFNLPVQNWKEILPIMADCMSNCTFKQELLNSELKAVVQELKMYRDNNGRSLAEKMITLIFSDHPYHYPVIGFKRDLYNASTENLMAFYKEHYIPNNAVLVVVGDIDQEEVFAQAEKVFGDIQPNWNYKKEHFDHTQDISKQSVILYRDITIPSGSLFAEIPGLRVGKPYLPSLLSIILSHGKNSRFQKALIDEQGIASGVGAMPYELHDYDLFVIPFSSREGYTLNQVQEAIKQELQKIVDQGFTENEVVTAVKKYKSGLLSLMENTYNQAASIGEYFIAMGNENYLYQDHFVDTKKIQEELHDFVRNYLHPNQFHEGYIRPFESGQKEQWRVFQELSDKEDADLLNARIRISEIESPLFVDQVKNHKPKKLSAPRPTEFICENGLKVLFYHNPSIPKISMQLDLFADADYDSEEKPGLYNMTSQLLMEGTKKYPGIQLAQEIESHAMGLTTGIGCIGMCFLSEDFNVALSILSELAMNANFEEKSIEKVRALRIISCKTAQDNPSWHANRLLITSLYKGHPFSRNALGTVDSLNTITQEDIQKFYRKIYTPDKARLIIVGDLTGHDVKKLAQEALGTWVGPKVENIQYPSVEQPTDSEELKKYMDRDQVVLIFAGPSIDRFHEDWDKLVLFNIIFGCGMSSRLFELREKSGAFYTIQGTLLQGSSQQPGFWKVSTLASKDRLDEARELITDTIKNVADTLTEKDLEYARYVAANEPNNAYSTSTAIAGRLATLDEYKLGWDYDEKRPETLAKITVDEVKEAVKKVLKADTMKTIVVGRV